MHPRPPYMHVKVIRLLLEHALERLSRQERHGRAIDPGIVCCARHARQIILPFLGLDWRARELLVVDLDAVVLHGGLHLLQGVCCHLVP